MTWLVQGVAAYPDQRLRIPTASCIRVRARDEVPSKTVYSFAGRTASNATSDLIDGELRLEKLGSPYSGDNWTAQFFAQVQLIELLYGFCIILSSVHLTTAHGAS